MGFVSNTNIIANNITALLKAGALDKAAVDSLYADKATLDSLFADKTKLDSLFADKATLDSLYADKAILDSLFADKTKLDSLFIDKATLDRIYTSISNIDRVFASIGKLDVVFASIGNVDTVAGSITNVDNVGGSIANVNSVAVGLADVNNYADTYYGSLATAPTIATHTTLTTGDLYFDTVLNELRVYDGNAWKSAGSTVNGTAQRQVFTATSGQIVFTILGGYDSGFADVYLNGRKLQNGVDVIVTSGTEVVLSVGATAGDIVDVIAYGAFAVANTYTKAEVDSKDALKLDSTNYTATDVLAKIKTVDGSGSGLDADLLDGTQLSAIALNANLKEIGVGQTWQDVTASRSAGVAYTNNTGKPISVSISVSNAGGNYAYVSLYADGIIVDVSNNTTPYPTNFNLSNVRAIIPSGSVYSIVIGYGALYKWSELR